MKRIMRSGILVFLLITLSLVASQQPSGKSFIFDVADLTTDFPDISGDIATLQGFAIMDNQKIIENKLVDRYGELMWASVGNPRVTRYIPLEFDTIIPVSTSPYFFPNYLQMSFFLENGLLIDIITLHDAHREELKKEVK